MVQIAGLLGRYGTEMNAGRLLRRIAQRSSAERAMKLINEGPRDVEKRLTEIARRG
jgi:hypothetical protein